MQSLHNLNNAPDERKYSRLSLNISSRVSLSDGASYSGSTENISFGGVLFKPSRELIMRPGDTCLLTLSIQNNAETLTVNFESEVIHTSATGIGLKYLSAYAENYADFVSLMVHSSPEPEKLIEQLGDNPGLTFHVFDSEN